MKRRAEIVDDPSVLVVTPAGEISPSRKVHLRTGTAVPPEPTPMASHADGVLKDAAGRVVARDPELVRHDPVSRTRVAFVERDSGPASAQAYRPVVEFDGKDEHGRTARFQQRATALEYLHQAGDITDAQIRAVRWLAGEIETAQLGASIQAVDWARVGGGFDPAKAFGPMGGDVSLGAMRNVQAALRALDWPDSLPARLLVWTIATGNGVAGWKGSPEAGREKRKHNQYLVGILVGAVVQLDIWYRSRG